VTEAHVGGHPGTFRSHRARRAVRPSWLHIDLSPFDRMREEEVERLLALGATLADVGQPADAKWTVMVDAEGNEFCVLRDVTEARTEPFYPD
jgi:Glyoxalase-like domain